MRASLSSLALLLPAFLAFAWLISRAQWFWNNNPELQFGWVVLLLCIYLFWEAWEARPAIDMRARWWVWVLGFAGAAFLIMVQSYWAVFGMHAAVIYGLAIGIMLLIGANLGLVFGLPGIRKFGLAFAFILVAMPLPGIIHGPVVGGLQGLIASINTEFLNLIGIPAQRVGSLIHLPVGTVGVDEACSGIRSLQSTIMATIFIGYLTLKRVSWQILLFFSGILLAVFGNVVRSLYLSLTANARGIEAISEVHDAAGWSILIFTTVGVIAISWGLNKLERVAEATSIRPAATPSGPPPAVSTA